MVKFKEGIWQGNPPKGGMTPRKSVGCIKDDVGVYWEILYWEVKDKSPAAQIHIRYSLLHPVKRKIFFSTREDAHGWMKDPINPMLDEIKAALRKCKWHRPSRGLLQKWVNFQS